MSRRLILAGMLFTLFASLAAAQDAKTVIAAASKAMGADTLNTIEFSGSGADFAIGQAYSGNSPWPKFIDKTYTRQIDFRVPSSKMDRIRMQGENPAARRRPAAGPRRAAAEPDDRRQREHAVGAAARDRDAAAGLPAGRRGRERDREVADARRQEVHRRVLHRPEQSGGQRLHQRSEHGRARGDLDRQPGPRRHAVRGGLQRLQGLRWREVPDAHRAAAGRLPDSRSRRSAT